MDRRVKYTKQVIKDAFLELLQQKDITKISVMELCKKCDINRATFYRYYIDIYDLLKNIQDSFVSEIVNSDAMNDLPNYTIYDYTKEILEIFFNNKKLVKILFDTNNNIYFINDVLDIAYEKLINKWLEAFPSSNEEEIEFAVVYIFNGALGIINYWIKNDFEQDIDTISNYIKEFTLDGIRKYVR
jgi:AcrR family transcriptional regulator